MEMEIIGFRLDRQDHRTLQDAIRDRHKRRCCMMGNNIFSK